MTRGVVVPVVLWAIELNRKKLEAGCEERFDILCEILPTS
jgi:hypothetical protein